MSFPLPPMSTYSDVDVTFLRPGEMPLQWSKCSISLETDEAPPALIIQTHSPNVSGFLSIVRLAIPPPPETCWSLDYLNHGIVALVTPEAQLVVQNGDVTLLEDNLRHCMNVTPSSGVTLPAPVIVRTSPPSAPSDTPDSRRILRKRSIHEIRDDESGPAASVPYETVSLLDPVSHQRIRVPVRGNDCMHKQCFDRESFLQRTAGQSGSQRCPVCKNITKALLVSKETREALKQFPEDVTTLVVKPGGKLAPLDADSKGVNKIPAEPPRKDAEMKIAPLALERGSDPEPGNRAMPAKPPPDWCHPPWKPLSIPPTADQIGDVIAAIEKGGQGTPMSMLQLDPPPKGKLGRFLASLPKGVVEVCRTASGFPVRLGCESIVNRHRRRPAHPPSASHRFKEDLASLQQHISSELKGFHDYLSQGLTALVARVEEREKHVEGLETTNHELRVELDQLGHQKGEIQNEVQVQRQKLLKQLRKQKDEFQSELRLGKGRHSAELKRMQNEVNLRRQTEARLRTELEHVHKRRDEIQGELQLRRQKDAEQGHGDEQNQEEPQSPKQKSSDLRAELELEQALKQRNELQEELQLQRQKETGLRVELEEALRQLQQRSRAEKSPPQLRDEADPPPFKRLALVDFLGLKQSTDRKCGRD